MMENRKSKCKEYGCNSGVRYSLFDETEYKVMLKFTNLYIKYFSFLKQEFSKWVCEDERLLKKIEEKYGNKRF